MPDICSVTASYGFRTLRIHDNVALDKYLPEEMVSSRVKVIVGENGKIKDEYCMDLIATEKERAIMNIKEIAGLNNLYELFLQDFERAMTCLVLYGAGTYCDWAMRFLSQHGIVPDYIIDKNKKGEKNAIPIISLQDARVLYENKPFRVLIATPMYEEEARTELYKFVAKERIYSFECELYYSFIHDLDAYRKFLLDNENNLMEFYYELEDEFSRDTMENVLKGRVSGDLAYFRKCRRPDQYFIRELFDKNMKGTFLDVGASIGDTLEKFFERTEHSFEKLYCFEPSQDAYEILQKKAEKYGDRIVLVNKGAWDKKEVLRFHQDAEHGASKIVSDKQEKTIQISADKLDAMVDSKDKVVHIKMDIEGAEERALKGASEIIKRDKPMLAICVYHKNDDLIRIPQIIKGLVPEYKFYLRHHNVAGTETVLYAVV